uniref:Borealin N-terminal domain-containing protein n=1 Tax=Ciona savignyi TaxID=51511 RepID=H2Z2S2_CIOSA
MARKRKVVKKQVKDENLVNMKQMKIDEIIQHHDAEVEMQIEAMRRAAQSIVDNMKKELNMTLMSLPKHVKEMTVREYLQKFLSASKAQGEPMEETSVDLLATPHPSANASGPICFVDGTPVVGARTMNVTSTAKRLMSRKDAADCQLQFISSAGSPLRLATSEMSKEMQKKIADAFAVLLNEAEKEKELN